jgi:hypothetical protein
MSVAQWAARGLALVATACALVFYFRAVSENSRQKYQLAQRDTQVRELKNLLQEANSNISDLRNALSGERQNFESVSRYANALQAHFQQINPGQGGVAPDHDGTPNAEPDAAKFTIEFRRARLSDGQVGVVTNASDKYISITIKAYRPNNGQQKTMLLQLGPNEHAEVGHLEGWVFDHGDRVALTATGSAAVESEVP